jgi:hypothetical protein
MAHGSGYLQYRAGDFTRVDVEFPQRNVEYRALFNYLHVFPYGSDTSSVSFVKDGEAYELFSHFQGPPGAEQADQGLRISTGNAPDNIYHCQGPVIDQLKTLEQIF